MGQARKLSRRRFLRTTAGVGAAGVAAPYIVPASVLAAPGRTGANDRIQIGVIGTGGQANWHLDVLRKQPDVDLVAVCDVWQARLDRAVAKCEGKPRPFRDYRELLALDDVDAVLIASPPHWHALHAIHACEAGKDIYLEKPMTLHLAESFAVRNAVRRHNRISQIGTQIHATDNYRQIVDIIRSGALGKISVARTFHVLNDGAEGIGNPPVGEPPEGLDVDFWCGPAPLRYHPLLVKGAYTHGSFMDYSGGWTPGMAPHIVDLPYWAMELGHPTRVHASGGRYLVHDCGDAYDVHEVVWQYPDFTLTWATNLINSYGFDNHGKPGRRRRRGIYFQGVNGTLIADYGYRKIVPETDGGEVEEVRVPVREPERHHRDWLEGIRTRKPPKCNVDYHYKIDVALNLSLLALKLGRSICFDPKTETIAGDAEATRLTVPTYREPWVFPKQYLA